MASGFYGGDFAKALVIHKLDDEDTVDVGPVEGWTNASLTFETDFARFDKNIFSQVGGARLDSDGPITGFDGTDGNKILFACFVAAPDVSGVKTMAGFVSSAFNVNRTRMFFFAGRLHVDWTRQSDLAGPSTTHMRLRSKSPILTIDTSHSFVGFLDSGDASEGKTFVDGVDETFDLINDGSFGALATNHQHMRIGNHFVGLGSDQYVDHLTVVQDSSMDDAKVTALVAAGYDQLQGFGYRPKFTSLVAA